MMLNKRNSDRHCLLFLEKTIISKGLSIVCTDYYIAYHENMVLSSYKRSTI